MNLTAIKILIALTSHAQLGGTGKATGYWLSEASHAYFAFRQAGYDVQFVSPKGGMPPVDPGSVDLSDPLNKAFAEDPAIQAQLRQSLRPEQVNARDYRAIYFAGGHGAMWDFANNPFLTNLATSIHSNGGVVASVCHGVVAFTTLTGLDGKPMISGHRVAGFSNAEEDAIKLTDVVPFSLQDRLVSLGGLYESGPSFESFAVDDNRLVSGQNPASSRAVAERVVRLLKTDL